MIKEISAENYLGIEIQEHELFDHEHLFVFEDDDIIVINKSSGISMHPGAGNYDNTIVNALMNYNKNSLSNIGDELRPGIVHRIDKNTSGLIVVAKNNQAHENLSKQFNKHSIIRIYELLYLEVQKIDS